MADSVIFVGTAGQAVWRSDDSGASFRLNNGAMFMEAEVRALAVDYTKPGMLYAGTDAGLYRTDNAGGEWRRMELPFDTGEGWQAGTLIWSALIDPHNAATLFVGTCPGAVYRSQDAGVSWEKLNIPIPTTCDYIRYTRVTCLVADPRLPGHVWAGVEIGGLWHSSDGGDTWTQRDEGMSSPDLHGLAILYASKDGPPVLLATTNNDLNRSIDSGATWQPLNIGATFPHGYCRGITQKTDDPQTLFVGNGSGPPGHDGSLHVSHDGGATWHTAALPAPPNSTVWTFATHPALPDTIVTACVLGYVYLSDDGGATWRKCPHEFGEIRSLALLPA